MNLALSPFVSAALNSCAKSKATVAQASVHTEMQLA